jgi:hypothetical protein
MARIIKTSTGIAKTLDINAARASLAVHRCDLRK